MCFPICGKIFSSQSSDLARSTTKSNPDFTIKDEKPAKSSGNIFQRLIMVPLYPAQSNFLKKRVKQLNPSSLNEFRPLLLNAMKGSIVREVMIERNGVRYDALLVGHPKALQNGRWILQATGNACPIERAVYECSQAYFPADFNLLMVNGPSVGRSGGLANACTIGEAQEGGLRFLETALKAKQIAIAGHSLGGSAIGQAILQHRFKKDISYLVIRQYAFDRTSNIVKKIIKIPILKHIAKRLIHWTDLEMDNVKSSKKLQDLDIREIIVQAVSPKVHSVNELDQSAFASDGVIPAKASLGYRLLKEGVIRNKQFICIQNGDHNDEEGFLGATRDALIEHFPKASVTSKAKR